MNLSQERRLFLAAALYCIKSVPRYTLQENAMMESYVQPLAPRSPCATIMWSKGSKFKHRPCVAMCWSNDAGTRRFLAEFDPATVVHHLGHTYFLYEDGYDVMAGSGALATLRREAESEVLQ